MGVNNGKRAVIYVFSLILHIALFSMDDKANNKGDALLLEAHQMYKVGEICYGKCWVIYIPICYLSLERGGQQISHDIVEKSTNGSVYLTGDIVFLLKHMKNEKEKEVKIYRGAELRVLNIKRCKKPLEYHLDDNREKYDCIENREYKKEFMEFLCEFIEEQPCFVGRPEVSLLVPNSYCSIK